MGDLNQSLPFMAQKSDNPLALAFSELKAGGMMMDMMTRKSGPIPDWPSFWAKRRPQFFGAYINIPFCQSICGFCGFYKVRPEPDLLKSYLTALISEIRRQGHLASDLDLKISALYLGGGTPSILSASEIERLFSEIKLHLPLTDDCEITFEARLSTLDEEKLKVIFASSINRLSIGIQSFDTSVRREAGRKDSREEIIEKLSLIRENFSGLTVIDLIYGLPGQSLDIFASDLDLAASCKAHGVAFYLLKAVPGSLWHKDITSGLKSPLDGLAKLSEYYALAVKKLSTHGLERSSNNHFSLPSTDRNRYNRLSMGRYSIMAFGAGAGGNHEGSHYYNTRQVSSYIEKIEQKQDPVALFQPSQPDYEIQDKISRQVQSGTINLDNIEIENGQRRDNFERYLEQWQSAGLLYQSDGGLSLTTAGYFWSPNLEFALRSLFDPKA
ncbi:MAG: radical SAM protein [Deltaproteobacteria bacterium]|jgi:oxygen-independent coproporphyrinogen-3 oxidase|nr:radical SAM protein [Deltaproteobacteria bacterium]